MQSAEIDLTIVNPAEFDAGLRDSVCQQCHLQGSFRFTRAGREPLDFRPGLPIHRFLAVFLMKAENRNKFEAVGHVEQMAVESLFHAPARAGSDASHVTTRIDCRRRQRRSPIIASVVWRAMNRRGCVLPAAERQSRGQGETTASRATCRGSRSRTFLTRRRPTTGSPVACPAPWRRARGTDRVSPGNPPEGLPLAADDRGRAARRRPRPGRGQGWAARNLRRPPSGETRRDAGPSTA